MDIQDILHRGSQGKDWEQYRRVVIYAATLMKNLKLEFRPLMYIFPARLIQSGSESLILNFKGIDNSS